MERSASMARASRLYSSITFKSFSILASDVWSNWKSRAHTTLGLMGQNAPTATPMPRSGRFFLR
jgi:hypothetical protein